jgi:TRAP-type C4-dicarboxylate transport system permease small subunit
VLIVNLPKRAAKRLEQVTDVAAAALCLLLCYYGVRAAISEFEDGTLPDKDLSIANWYMISIFAVSFLLLAIEFLLRIRRAGKDGSGSGSGF